VISHTLLMFLSPLTMIACPRCVRHVGHVV